MKKPAWFLINIHSKSSNLNAFRAKLVIIFIFLLINCTFISQFILPSFNTIFCYFNATSDNPYTKECQALFSDKMLLLARVVRYISVITPYIVSSYLAFVIHYVSKFQFDEEDDDADDETD